MDFSSNSKQLALGFADGSVGVVALLTFKGGQTRWDIVGQQTAHPAPASLVGLTFGEAPSGVTKLFSLGNNNTIICTLYAIYNLHNKQQYCSGVLPSL